MTNREQIRKKALEIVSNTPEGISSSILKKQIHEALPSILERSIPSSMWDLDKIYPAEIYKPARGIFRHLKYKNGMEPEMREKRSVLPSHSSKLVIPISELIDCDRIATTVLTDLIDAVKGWLRGFPTDEVALLNRITENLCKHRQACDIGVKTPLSVSVKTSELHRKERDHSDRYGADLAVSLYIPGARFLKTAYFQLKKCDNFSLSLKQSQLNASQVDIRIGSNSYVIAVNEKRIGFRLESVSRLLSDFNAQKEKNFDATNWMFLTEWLLKWLTGQIGTQSNLHDPYGVESLMQNYATDTKEFDLPMVQTQERFEGELTPARVWLVVQFTG